MLKKLLQILKRQAKLAPAAQDREILVRLITKIRRDALRKAWRAGKTLGDQAHRRRAIRAKSRKGIRQLKLKPIPSKEHQKLLLRKFRSSRVLDRLLPSREAAWIPLKSRKRSEPPPAIELTNFSFLDDPRGTIAGIVEIARLEAAEGQALIHFKDPYCLDVAPLVLLSEFWDELLPIFRGGEMSPAVQKVVAIVGLYEALHMRLGGLTELQDVWAFPLKRRRPAGRTRSSTSLLDVQKREFVTDEFCEALDEWLAGLDTNLGLTPEGVGWIKNIFGELLDNAERHSDGERQDGDWALAGFMARRKRADGDGEGHDFLCHLGFVNLGDSFSESLERASDATREKLNEYVRRCSSAGCQTSPETLRTLYAIQDGVTCVEKAEAEKRGGVGLQEMLELVNMLGRSARGVSTRVTIVSGSSCIMLKAPYIEAERKRGDDMPRVLWCNPANSSLEPPSSEHVFDLEHHVPGTIISVGFTLDPEFLDGNDDGRDQARGSDEESGSQSLGS